MTQEEFIRFRRPYERALPQLLLDFEFFLEDIKGVQVYLIDHRLKSFESASVKAQRLGIPITELQDIAGMRVVVATGAQVDIVARFFSRKAVSKDLTILSDRHVEKADGYRARHLVLGFGGHYSRSMHPARVEVQCLTITQHAFNFVSRAWPDGAWHPDEA
jgi:ppGpp synthetase/RelA/SpoT-type nucleotidyltranferase